MGYLIRPKNKRFSRGVCSSVKLRYISDLHLEYYHLRKLSLPQIEPELSSECLALCGDIGNPLFPNYKYFLEDMANKFSKVFIISGNHEYYQPKENLIKQNIDQTDQLISKLCESFNNVYYLNNNSHEINNKLTIIGTTFWSNIFENRETIRHSVNDYNYIYFGDRMFDIDDSTRLNFINSKWIESEISKANHLGKKLVVLTHHLPSYDLIIPKYKGHFASCCFANHLDYLIKDPVVAWLCGHSHSSIQTRINGVYCGINAVGYQKQQTGFDYNQSVEIVFDE